MRALSPSNFARPTLNRQMLDPPLFPLTTLSFYPSALRIARVPGTLGSLWRSVLVYRSAFPPYPAVATFSDPGSRSVLDESSPATIPIQQRQPAPIHYLGELAQPDQRP